MTVNGAFSEFMRDKVNLETSKTSTARTSRDNLISNLNGFSGDEDFFNVYADKKFKAISGDNVVYDVVNSYTSLIEKVMK